MVPTWRAVYKDGSYLNQYNDDRSENKYSDINRSELVQFHLLQDNKSVIVIHLDPEKKLIYRKRVAMHFAGTKAGTSENVYLVGWQEKRRDVNIQMICFVFEGGHIEVVDRFYENHQWFYPIRFLPEEKVD